jgi:hypothetical protein
MLATADPWGCLPGSATKIRALCLGMLDGEDGRQSATVEDVRDWLDELKQVGRITRHRNGATYIEITNFDHWQPMGQLRRRGPSEFLHPDGIIPEDEARPHDKRRARSRDRKGRFLAQPSRALQKSQNGAPETETETERETDSQRRASSEDRADAFAIDPIDAVSVLVAALTDADTKTERVLRSLAMPEAAYRTALEILNDLKAQGKAPRSDSAWVVAWLKARRRDGTYA